MNIKRNVNCNVSSINRLDTEIEQVTKSIQATDPGTPEYKTLIKNLDKLVKIKKAYIDSVDPSVVDQRNQIEKLCDSIDLTDIAKVVLVGGFLVFALKYEMTDVISGQVKPGILRLLTSLV